MYYHAPKNSTIEEVKKLNALTELYHILGMSALEYEKDCEDVTILIPTYSSFYDYLVTGDYLDVSFHASTVKLCHDFSERFFDLVDVFNCNTNNNITIEIL